METVLIIEDDPTMLIGLKDNFEFKGYKVLTAADGEKGLNAALNAKPDLILLDIMLPKINGVRSPTRRLNKVDFPTLGLPTSATIGRVIFFHHEGHEGH